jgi:ABC-2 type transport system ATP-binding protein
MNTMTAPHRLPLFAEPLFAQETVMEAPTALRVEQAFKAFGARQPHTARPAGASAAVAAAEGVSFDVHPGEIFGLLGPNGSGKSTLIRLIATQLVPDGGRIQVFGRDVAGDPRAVHGVVNRVPVETGFFKRLSAVENLVYGARLSGVRPGETRRRVIELLQRLGLPERDLYRPMESLSRGVQQKVMIGRAFLDDPRLLLLDEPTSGLDPRSRRDVQLFIRELRTQHGTTVVLATHDMAEAETLCDRVAILDHGRVVALDSPGALKRAFGPTLEDAFLGLTGGE